MKKKHLYKFISRDTFKRRVRAYMQLTLDVILDRNTYKSKDDNVVDNNDWKNFPLSSKNSLEATKSSKFLVIIC